jgi:hypothetical protein
MKKPSVYGVLLNYNGKKHLEYCVPSLLKTDYPNFRIVLVDNGSTDGSVDYVKKKFGLKNMDVVSIKKNRGYSRGMNVGITYALKKNADFICTINNDVMVDPRWVEEGVKVMEKHPEVGFVGYDLLGMEIRGDVDRFEREKNRRKKFTLKYKKYVIDALMLARSEVFRNVGGFDEKYKSYGEEEDLYARTMLAGYKIVEISVPTYHYGHGTFDRTPIKRSYLMMRNSIRYALKWLPWIDVIKRMGYILHVGCNPFAKVDENNLVASKIRPSNIFFNFFLVLSAYLWNLFFLPQTLMIMRKEKKRALLAKEMLKKAR